MILAFGDDIVVRSKVYSLGMTAAILRRMVRKNLAPGSLLLSLYRSQRRMSSRGADEVAWISDFLGFLDGALALSCRLHHRQLHGVDALRQVQTMARLHAFLASGTLDNIAKWFKEGCFALLDASLKAGDDDATGLSVQSHRRAKVIREQTKKRLGTRSSHKKTTLFHSLIRQSGLQSFREGIAFGLSARVLPAPILDHQKEIQEAQALKLRLTRREPPIKRDELYNKLVASLTFITQRVASKIRVDTNLPTPSDSKITVEGTRAKVRTERCIRQAAVGSGGQWDQFVSQVRNVEPQEQCNKALFLAEPGYKIRLASIPGRPDMVVAGRACNKILLQALSRSFPSQTTLGIGTGEKSVLAGFRRPARPQKYRVYSADLTAASDFINRDWAMSAMEPLIDAMVAQGFHAAESVFWDQLPANQDMVVCHSRESTPFESFRMMHGVLMGKPLTWPTLSILQLTALHCAGLLERAHIVGDDSLMYASAEEYQTYVDAMERMGFVMNRRKTHVSKRYGILAQNTVSLRGTCVPNRKHPPVIQTRKPTLWDFIGQALNKKEPIPVKKVPETWKWNLLQVSPQIPYVPKLLAARGQLRKDPGAEFNLPNLRECACLPRWVRDRIPNAFMKANPTARRRLTQRGVNITYPSIFGGAAGWSERNVAQMSAQHRRGAFALGRYLLAHPGAAMGFKRLFTTQATHTRITVTPVAVATERYMEDLPVVAQGQGCNPAKVQEAVRQVLNHALLLEEFNAHAEQKPAKLVRLEKKRKMRASSHPAQVLNAFARKANKLKPPTARTVYEQWEKILHAPRDIDPKAVKPLWRLSLAASTPIRPSVRTDRITNIRQLLQTVSAHEPIVGAVGDLHVAASLDLFETLVRHLSDELERVKTPPHRRLGQPGSDPAGRVAQAPSRKTV